MFHSRLTAYINQSRMAVAILLAVAAHIGFMGFEFKADPFNVPEISLPRSVSVLLVQKEFSGSEANEKQTTEETAAKEENPDTDFKNVLFPAPDALPKIQNTPLRSVIKAVNVEKKEPLAYTDLPKEEKTVTAPEPEAIGNVQQSNTLSEKSSHQEESTVVIPGILQMAYPSYHLNDPPSYPRLARKRGQQGTVILQVLVNQRGRVADLKIENSSNYTMLDRAALKAVRQWIFEPGRKGDSPIETWVKVPVTFKLRNEQ